MFEPDGDSPELETAIGAGNQPALVPRCCSLSGFVLEVGSNRGLSLDSLMPGTALVVETRNSRYRLILLEGRRDAVLVQGGARFETATEAHLQGASAGGSLVKTRCIEVGLRLELSVGRERIITSPVRSIAIESVPPVLHLASVREF